MIFGSSAPRDRKTTRASPRSPTNCRGGFRRCFSRTPPAGARPRPLGRASTTIRISATACNSSNISTAIPAAAAAQRIKPGGPASSPSSSATPSSLPPRTPSSNKSNEALENAMTDPAANQAGPRVPAPPLPPLPKLLAGQRALVTGANSGIGKAVALALAEAGADVGVNYVVEPDQAEDVAEAARGFGVDARIYKADVSSEAEVQAMFAGFVANH